MERLILPLLLLRACLCCLYTTSRCKSSANSPWPPPPPAPPGVPPPSGSPPGPPGGGRGGPGARARGPVGGGRLPRAAALPLCGAARKAYESSSAAWRPPVPASTQGRRFDALKATGADLATQTLLARSSSDRQDAQRLKKLSNQSATSLATTAGSPYANYKGQRPVITDGICCFYLNVFSGKNGPKTPGWQPRVWFLQGKVAQKRETA